jgi:hypothetical protein
MFTPVPDNIFLKVNESNPYANFNAKETTWIKEEKTKFKVMSYEFVHSYTWCFSKALEALKLTFGSIIRCSSLSEAAKLWVKAFSGREIIIVKQEFERKTITKVSRFVQRPSMQAASKLELLPAETTPLANP